jgi:hypothetical protein
MPRKSAVGALASAQTKAEFADVLSSYTTLTADEVQTLFPAKADRDELLELLKIVSSATTANQKQAALISNIQKVAGAALKVVGKVVKPV